MLKNKEKMLSYKFFSHINVMLISIVELFLNFRNIVFNVSMNILSKETRCLKFAAIIYVLGRQLWYFIRRILLLRYS